MALNGRDSLTRGEYTGREGRTCQPQVFEEGRGRDPTGTDEVPGGIPRVPREEIISWIMRGC
jgi:hypothetical protein